MRQIPRKFWLPVLLLALIAPFLLGQYSLHVLIVAFYYVIVVSSWNVLTGYAGQMSFAQAAFSTFGGYVSTLSAIHIGVPPVLGIILGATATCILGFLLGVVCLKMQGIYHALTTLAFAEIFRSLASMEYNITRGSLGLGSPGLFGDITSKIPYYYSALLLTVLTLIILDRIISSPVGLSLKAVREDQTAAATMGINVVRYKQFAFMISSFFAGLGGAFLAHYLLLVSPESATISQMAIMISMAVIGGLGSFTGPIVGAVGVQVLSEYVRQFGEFQLVLFGAVLVLVLRFMPEGLVLGLANTAKSLLQRQSRNRSVASDN